MGERVLFLFIDGLGLGRRDPALNPLARFQPSVLCCYREGSSPLPRAGVCQPTDACLGVAGLPQSATGQSTLLTGYNAARLLGRHLGGFPNRDLRNLIRRESIFMRLSVRGLRPLFANAYTPRRRARQGRVSVTTAMCLGAGVPLKGLQDLAAGRALYADFTNRLLCRRGHPVPLTSPRQAARILARLSRQAHLCLYEYFLTDLVGHRGNLEQAARLLEELDRMLFHLLEEVDLDEVSILLSSDHGNVEDMSTGHHTRNPVPTMVWGRLARHLPRPGRPFALSDVAPLLERFLSGAARVKRDEPGSE